MDDMISIVIADDQMLTREGLKSILDLEDDMEVIGVANNGEEACFLAANLRPSVVIMDVEMPVMNGIAALKGIKQCALETYVLILSTFLDDDYIVEAMAYGASGYLLKDMDVDQMIVAIRDTVVGKFILPTAVASKLAVKITQLTTEIRMAAMSPPQIGLTEREKELAKFILKGFNNREIASAMYISEGTVRNYISNLYGKLGVVDRAQAIVRLHKLM
jgi:DNA-binding NarL/FixJ family response regulator